MAMLEPEMEPAIKADAEVCAATDLARAWEANSVVRRRAAVYTLALLLQKTCHMHACMYHCNTCNLEGAIGSGLR